MRAARSLSALLLALAAACGSPGAGPAPRAAPDPPRGELRVVVVSDLNGSYGSTDYEPTVERAVALIRDVWRPDLVLAAGDLIAGQRPSLSDARVRAMWAAFDSVVARPLREAGIPFAFTVGNHDASAYPAHARDRALAAEHWRDPARVPRLAFVDSAAFPFRYAFRRGEVFFLSWDASYAGTALDTAQTAWAERVLSGPEARGAAMRIALGHLPLHAVAEGRDRAGEVLEAPDSLRALLERHGVHTYVSGHHHAYYPGRRGRLDLLHAGALGQGPRPLLGSDLPPSHTVTVLDLWPAADSVADHTYRLDPAGGPLEEVDPATLPEEIRGAGGRVTRRDLAGRR